MRVKDFYDGDDYGDGFREGWIEALEWVMEGNYESVPRNQIDPLRYFGRRVVDVERRLKELKNE